MKLSKLVNQQEKIAIALQLLESAHDLIQQIHQGMLNTNTPTGAQKVRCWLQDFEETFRVSDEKSEFK